MKRARLKHASSVGWHGEFPIDIWSILINYMPLTSYGTLDLGMTLRLLSVCKGMLGALMDPILAYLSFMMDHYERWEVIAHRAEPGKKDELVCMTWSVIDQLQKKGDYRVGTLTRYIRFCSLDRRYQTIEHLSNCLSLLHYGYLEGCYARERTYAYGSTYWSKRVLGSPGDRYSLRDVYYLQPTNKKAVILARMAEVSVYDYIGYDVVRERARQCLIKQRFSAEYANTATVFPGDGANVAFGRLFDIIEEEEKNMTERTFKSRKARVRDCFENIIVTYKNKRYHIYSEALEDFRARCFYLPNETCHSATYCYLLIKSREANEASINDAQRFYIPSDISLISRKDSPVITIQ